MSGRLEEALAALKTVKHPALMTHVVVGFPCLKDSLDVVRAMVDAGARFVELQIPFSDPIADGPTIMGANQAALNNGVTPSVCLRALEKLRKNVEVPLLFMTYFNILYNYAGGTVGFFMDAANAGCDGLIVPDIMPEDETEGFWECAKDFELPAIPIVSPLTDEKRLKLIAPLCAQSFAYCVSTTGTTGARKELSSDLKPYLRRVRNTVKRPLAVGFGLSKAEHLKQLSGLAEIAVVGSATIDLLTRTPPKSRIRETKRFISELIA